MKVNKAVFPVAGLGSRFLPATKANPKEMLPIVDKPLIQYAVEEAVKAGLDHMIFITSNTKRAIEDHFDENFELESKLREGQKHALLDIVKNIAPNHVKFTYVRQDQAKGLGHAIMCAQHVIGQDPFAVLLADDLIDDSQNPCLKTMIESYESINESIIAVQQVPWNDVSKYGIVDSNPTKQSISPINAIIEKPARINAPSNFAAIGRYVFTCEIFNCLKQTKIGAGGEIQLSDAISSLLSTQTVNAFHFRGKRYDCGSKLGYLQATVEYALKHQEIKEPFKHYLESQIKASHLSVLD